MEAEGNIENRPELVSKGCSNSGPCVKKVKRIGIIYHHPCYDGAFAAINAYLYFKYLSTRENTVVFFPSKTHQSIQEAKCEELDKILIVDKGLKEDELEFALTFANDNKTFLLFDHHLSFISDFEKNWKEKFSHLKNFSFILDYNNERSGCTLVLNYYLEKACKKRTKEEVNSIFTDDWKKINDFIEDSDTGSNKLDYTHQFKSGISQYLNPLTTIGDFTQHFKYNLNKFLNVDLKFTIRNGEKSYKKYKKNSKNEIAGKNCYIIELTSKNNETEKWKFIICYTQNKHYRNYACPILSQISSSHGMSSIGGFLYHCEADIYKLSLRTHSPSMDLGYICSLFGGGGHKTAAAFSEKKSFFDEQILQKIDLYTDLLNY